jgi:threonylcarbamoyladenosine tRNA methylthiotransferase MtaB
MARRNRVAEFEALIAAARNRIPGLTITTDLIAGFPGETEADFEETVAFAERAQFAHIHVFPYSARQGTAAARFGGQVPEPERKRRVRRLVALDAALGRAVRNSFVGQVRPVLWESRVEAEGGKASWSGLTDNYLRVDTVAPADADLRNKITAVQLTTAGGDYLTAIIS